MRSSSSLPVPTTFAAAIPIGFFSWDVTIPGSAGEFDIVNETGPNSTGDPTFPVSTSVNLSSLALKVLFSDGSSQSFSSSYFTLDPFDGLSWEGSTIPIGGANPLPVGATLTGLFSPLALTLFDGSSVTISSDFTSMIPVGGSPLADGTFAIINANTGVAPERCRSLAPGHLVRLP